MSKASEWATQRRPEFIFPSTAAVASVDDGGNLALRIPTPASFSHESMRITVRHDVAVSFARWILDTFGEEPAP